MSNFSHTVSDLDFADIAARYQHLLEHGDDGILIADDSGQSVEANAHACALLGRDMRDVIGAPVRSLFAAQIFAGESLGASMREGEATTLEDIALRGDGTRVPVKLSIAALPGGRVQVIARQRSMRVLIVEDDAVFAQVIATTLEGRGCDVAVTHAGANALARFHERGADVLIIDLGLPDMSGLDVLEWMRVGGESQTVPAIVYTAADVDGRLRDRARASGAEVAIKRRTSPEALADEVDKLVRGAR